MASAATFRTITRIEKPMNYWLKKSSWLLLLTGCLLCGCVGGPLPEKAAWPWESAKENEKNQTGNFFSIRGNVANFGEPPRAVKPVSPEELAPPVPDAHAAAETVVTKTQLPLLPAQIETGPGKAAGSAKNGYDFEVRDIQLAPPSYLPTDPVRPAFAITAFNHGNAPVSVTIGVDPAASQNVAADKPLPFTAVVPPHSSQVLVRIGPKMKADSYNFRTSYSWNIGDYAASHNCPERYQFPFGYNIKAFAHVSDAANTAAYTRYAVIFSVPVGSPVLAARKGVVVQVRPGTIDILHNDATIATYGHLGKISAGISAGKAVTTEDIIGVAGTTADKEEGYLQLTVWRPEPLAVASSGSVAQREGFDFVSFPLEFCSADSGQCSVITEDQVVSRNKLAGSRKQGVRKPKTRRKVGT